MQSFLAVGNRREFLKLSGTIGFGLVGITLVSWPTGVAARSDQLPGFDPGKANRDQIEKWTGLAVNSVNSILAGTATFSDFDSLANTYRDCLLYLDKLGFDEAGAKYIVENKDLPVPAERSVTNWYEQVIAVGLKISRGQWNNSIIPQSRNREYLAGVLALFRKGQAVQFHQDVANSVRSAAKESPALQARNDGFVLSSYHERVLRAKFSEHTCMYLDWGGAYLGVVALPIGVTPVGVALGVLAIGLWAVAKIGGC